MKNLFLLIFLILGFSSCSQKNDMKLNNLTKEEERVIVNKGTEAPYSGEFYKFDNEGTYLCKRCDAPLYKSNDKFDAQCGWPSFDDEINGAVKRIPDKDGQRTEIVCANCNAHLGHVFLGEGFTDKNTRHCVNSISLKFEPLKISAINQNTETAIFAGGCFWGVEYYFQNKKGVVSAESGYIGGNTENPSYQDVCYNKTGHIEAVKVTFNPLIVSYEELAKLFFEIHDPTQTNRQGPDIGVQYQSAIFYQNNNQKEIAQMLIKQLETKGLKISTQIIKANTFWQAEDYHQDYYFKNGKKPYCHFYTKRF
jgi:peptide methionine sulfoxide reductase msrA/msrB